MIGYSPHERDCTAGAWRDDPSFYLAAKIGVTADELLGIKPIKKGKKPDTRLQRRIQQIEKLPTKDRRQLMQVIDTFLEAAHYRKSA